MEKHLHIICFTVPYPITYGGVFDLYYKLEALYKQGIHIHLHCFVYNKMQEQNELTKYCTTVNYYKRNKSFLGLLNNLPFIVFSRKNKILLNNLLKNDYPILMEGIHCSYLVTDKRFTDRKKFIRLHNIESVYYAELAKAEKSFFKKWYYKRESRLLKKYEDLIKNKADNFICVAQKDEETLLKFGFTNATYVPVFLPNWQIKNSIESEKYCLYHGDLSVVTNEGVVLWLYENIFKKINTQFIIAGKNPTQKIKSITNNSPNIKLIANPSEDEMQKLIADAHINIIYAESITGIKLKLLNALFNGKHCVTNALTIAKTNLDVLCKIADTAEEMRNMIETLLTQPFTNEERKLRKEILQEIFNNEKSAQKLNSTIWR
ncbi:MAG: glycosyltransferase [Bacteroidetes bacterium]|nr:glycosyltransferase [Bacteroidota bacterium]MBS1591021.1 glycosyltransferase [Bacteroidota bacterium]